MLPIRIGALDPSPKFYVQYMILVSNASLNTQYDYIYSYHIVCNHEYFLGLAVVVFSCPNLVIQII